ncbi:hypothetical protein F6J84_04405 [Microbacterium caowuchunii]|uniref:hypothetical protein n=1 Tax=Microbacterium caowuchunii TaxID=2614638 RepID=UPI001248CFE3|nr:hypothetical protein [Microbacterium caowuchunii]QEV99425.1 hypothetical protein F6J84_04405 [Microbacterium caowuchunii]
MDDDDRAELAELRARAYGPSPAVEMDAAAWVRLQELESASRRRTFDAAAPAFPPAAAPLTTVPTASASASPASLVESPMAQPEVAAEREPTTPSQSLRTRRRRAVSRRMRWVWAASLLAVAAVSAAATYAVTSVRPVDPTTGLVPAALLDPDPAIGLPSDFWNGALADVEVYEYFGIWAMRSDNDVFGKGDCVLITSAESISAQDGSLTGPVYMGCEAGGLPATVQFALDAEWPDAVLEQHPVGTGLRFVLNDDRVGVFVSPVHPTPSPSAGSASR